MLLSIILLGVSVATTALAYLYGWPFFFFFLFIPLIPFAGERQVRRCPVCGWKTTGNERFCPCDGTPLQGSETGHAQGKD